MSFGKAAAIFALVLCLFSAVPFDVSDADVSQHADCGNVTVMTFDTSVGMDTKETVHVTFYVTNNNSYPVSIEMTGTGDHKIELTVSSGTFTVASKTTQSVTADLTTDKYTPQGDYTVGLKTAVIDNVGNKTETADDAILISVNLVSAYSAGDAYGKIMGLFENNLSEPMNSLAVTETLSIIGWAVAAIVIAFIAHLITGLLFRKLRKGESHELCKKITISVFAIAVVYGITMCLRVVGIGEDIVASDITLSNIIYTILGAYIVWCLYRGIVKLILLRNEDDDDSNDVDTSLIPLFNFVGKIIIVVATVGIILTYFGLNLTSVIAGAGLAGLGVSLGAKPAINEFFAGFTLLTTHPFKIGDMIRIDGGTAYIVKRIGILKTQLLSDSTNDVITVPNSKIMSSKITNLTSESRKYRNTFDVRVPFGTNIQLAKRLMKAAANEHQNVVSDGSVPKPSVMYYSKGDKTSITLRLAYYVKDYSVNGSTTGQIREAIAAKFKDNGISHPYTSKEITVHEGANNSA